MSSDTPNRCRVVLIAPQGALPETFERSFRAAIAGGDVASLILPQQGDDEASFQALAERIVPIAQEAGIAAMIAGDTRIADRVGADGVHVEQGRASLEDAIGRLKGRMMVGTGGVKTRDDALDLGETQPDYMLFGRFGYDNKPEAHPRNLTLGAWWAEMIQIPCIVMAGSDVRSVEAAAATAAEFVALSSAVFAEGVEPGQAVAEANAILDRASPRLEG